MGQNREVFRAKRRKGVGAPVTGKEGGGGGSINEEKGGDYIGKTQAGQERALQGKEGGKSANRENKIVFRAYH